jgi:hypothetical protein
MAYRVDIVPRAQRDLLHHFERINARSSANAPEKTAAAWNEVSQFFDRHLSR